MGLETGNTIGDLNANWPLGSDPKSQGDDHIRLVKGVMKNDVLSLQSGGTVSGAVTVNGTLSVSNNFLELVHSGNNRGLRLRGATGDQSALEIYDHARGDYTTVVRRTSGGDINLGNASWQDGEQILSSAWVVDGNLYVGNSTRSPNPGNNGVNGVTLNTAAYVSAYRDGTCGYYGRPDNGAVHEFRSATQQMGSIYRTSATSVEFRTTSDARTKSGIAPADPVLPHIHQLEIKTYDREEGEFRQRGVIAQEMQKSPFFGHLVGPVSNDEEVTAGGDTVLGLDYGNLIPFLVQAVQELSQEIDRLKAAP